VQPANAIFLIVVVVGDSSRSAARCASFSPQIIT